MVDITLGLFIIGILLTVYFWGKGDTFKRNCSIILTIISSILFGISSDREEAMMNNATAEANLSQLKTLPIDSLEIDIKFIQGIKKNRNYQ